MSLFNDLFHFITTGSIAGLPTWVIMVVIFVIGLIVGYLIHLFLKIAIIVAVVAFVAAYLGFFGLSLSALKDMATKYGPIAYQYGTLIVGILPLSVGFIIGVIVGFLLS